MKQICGMSLKELIQSVCAEYSMTPQLRKKERKSLHDRLGLFLRICEAVSFAHSKQVLHGDLKPGNIMVEDHEIYVMDWGNAAVLVKDRESCVLKDAISGTPGYLSPEAVRGECMDFRSEVFSLGLILFEMITLSRAFTGKNSHEILLKILDGKRNPIRHRFWLPIAPALRKILKKALDPLREKRYSSASALAVDLRSYLNGYPDL
jgi:serine/threonine protein kinase